MAALKRYGLAGWVLILIASASLATHARSQAVERNLPPPPPHVSAPVSEPKVAVGDDSRPIGPPLTALIAIDGDDTPLAAGKPAAGVDLHRVPRLVGYEARFGRFVGKPISRKLISEIESEILKICRDQGYPFVHLSTPQQEIGSGTLQVRVLNIVLGDKKVVGASKRDAAAIARRISIKPGDSINRSALAEDIDWLNRYPFRQATVVFNPSARSGATDLTVEATYQNPWAISAGYANSGSPQTGLDRYFGLAQAAVPGLRDGVVSYQATASSDALFGHDSMFSGGRPRYQSNALRISAPTFALQSFDLTIDYVRTNQALQVFAAEGEIVEATPAYRSALSNLSRRLSGEVVIGMELKRDFSRIRFGGIAINQARIDVYQALVGYSWRGDDPFGRSTFDIDLHYSPEDLNSHNTNAAFSSFSTGRFTDASYTLVNGAASHASTIGAPFGLKPLSVANTLLWQYASAALPPTEQMGLGGVQSVRGYTLDDGAMDSGLVLRNEVRAAAISLLHRGDLASPYAFVDAGYGRSKSEGSTLKAGSVGVGIDYQFDKHFSIAADGAMPFLSEGQTKSGHARLDIRITCVF